MSDVVAILSMLHESRAENSATRVFRGEPVLCRTLRRVKQTPGLSQVAILLWEDQLATVQRATIEQPAAMIFNLGARQRIGLIESTAAASRWADGWRGGLLGTCSFDRGFHAAGIANVLERTGYSSALLVDPSAGLVDPTLLATTIAHARATSAHEIIFSQAAPGLSGTIVRESLIRRLRTSGVHPGRLLHYNPDQPQPDPIGREGCVPTPTKVARTTQRFLFDSQRALRHIESWSASLNGTLDSRSAEQLIDAANRVSPSVPADVTVDLGGGRATSPVYRHRPAMYTLNSIEECRPLFVQIADDGSRLTLGGVGDPMLSGHFGDVLRLARFVGIEAIHVETDLLAASTDDIEALVDCAVDVVSVFLSAGSSAKYAEVMGVDRMSDVATNLKHLLSVRASRGRAVPIVAPTFVKCKVNLSEMEGWYDHWLRQLGSAVILGPGDATKTFCDGESI